MIRFTFALSAIVSFCGTTMVYAADKPRAIRAMSWNIRYDNPRDGVNAWKNRKDWVAQIIKTEKADIVGLQEALLRQLNDLKKGLPHLAVYGVGRDDGKTRGEHAPILYRRDRFAPMAKSTFWLSKTPEKPGSRDWDAAITRIASWIKLKDRRNGKVFYVLNTHFDHVGREARAKSAELLVEQLRKRFKDHPVILTGDFNTLPDSTPYKTLTGSKETKGAIFLDSFHTTKKKPQGPDSTWNGFRAIVPNRRIDFVFVSKGITVLSHRTLDEQKQGRFPSDHLPVLVELELEKEDR